MKQLPLRRRHSGQAVVLFALMLVALLAMVGLGIDGAYAYAQRRTQQGKADLAALAGAVDLPNNTAAKASAHVFSGKNGYTDGVDNTTVNATSPYRGPADGTPNPNKIEVVITRDLDSFFLRVIGIERYTVSARAVAYRKQEGEYLVYAHRNNCTQNWNNEENVNWSGSGNVVHGRVHSNSGLYVSGSYNSFGETTYVCADTDGTNTGKELHISGSGNTFASGPTTVSAVPAWPTPPEYSNQSWYTTLGCDYSVTGDFDLTSDPQVWDTSTTLKPGLYCAFGSGAKLTLSASDVTGTGVTFYSEGSISVSGSNIMLSPPTSGPRAKLLMAAWGGGGCDQSSLPSKAIEISGTNITWNGILFAPNGQANISGSDGLTIHGSVVACSASLSGSNQQLYGVVGGDMASQLVE